jgi:hypothetical protein
VQKIEQFQKLLGGPSPPDLTRPSRRATAAGRTDGHRSQCFCFGSIALRSTPHQAEPDSVVDFIGLKVLTGQTDRDVYPLSSACGCIDQGKPLPSRSRRREIGKRRYRAARRRIDVGAASIAASIAQFFSALHWCIEPPKRTYWC